MLPAELLKLSLLETSVKKVPYFSSRNIFLAKDCIFVFFFLFFFSSEGVLRLVGGFGNGAGRVEVFHNGAWGTVCDDGWDIQDALAVCRQLGYASAISAPPMANFGQGRGFIWLDNVNCLGNESSIDECPHPGWGIHDCHHGEDASVVCGGTELSLFLIIYQTRLQSSMVHKSCKLSMK